VEGAGLRFQFKGKSGKTWQLQVRDRRIAKIVRACQELPGRSCSSTWTRTARCGASPRSDVNAYLREITWRRRDGEGLPHLGRHRDGGAGAARKRSGARRRPARRRCCARRSSA
jgi:hypothetical protein